MQSITNISSVAFIYRASNPGEIFIEMKDDGHPIKLVRRTLCPIGGNWIGEAAKPDRGPLDTIRREIGEELSFDRPVRTWELESLDGMPENNFAPTPVSDAVRTSDDEARFNALKGGILKQLVPFGSYHNTITGEAMTRADPNNKRSSFMSLACYWAVPLNEPQWEELARLQGKFGNLSSESLTLMTSLDEIIKRGLAGAFGHDHVLRRFFLAFGLSQAKDFPITEGTASECAGSALASYEDYLQKYDVLKRP